MITFPPEFVTTKFPGYYWNTATQRLFSIKVTGELHEMKRSYPNRWTHWHDAYQVSVKGRRNLLTLEYLKSLNSQTIPVVYK